MPSEEPGYEPSISSSSTWIDVLAILIEVCKMGRGIQDRAHVTCTALIFFSVHSRVASGIVKAWLNDCYLIRCSQTGTQTRDGFDPRYTHGIVDWGALKIERFVLCGLVSPSRGQLLYHANVGWGRSAVITREEFSGRAVNQCDRSGHL